MGGETHQTCRTRQRDTVLSHAFAPRAFAAAGAARDADTGASWVNSGARMDRPGVPLDVGVARKEALVWRLPA